MLTLGYASGPSPKASERKMSELAALIGRLSKLEIRVRPLETYDDLTQATFRGEIDLAWLPPICFLVLARHAAVAPLAAAREVAYKSAIIVAPRSPLHKPASLRGARAAWVDRHSAAGYVVPRIKLFRLGVDPRTDLADEKLCGTHDAVVQAVATGAVDFGATWARPDGNRITGPWSRSAHEVRVLATFGAIPPDVICAHAELPKSTRKEVVGALKSIYSEKQSRWLVTQTLGTDALYRPDLELYGPLEDAVAEAYQNGLLGAAKPSEAPPAEPDQPPPKKRATMRALESKPRLPTIPDAVEDEASMSDVDDLLASTNQAPRWTLPEIEIEE